MDGGCGIQDWMTRDGTEMRLQDMGPEIGLQDGPEIGSQDMGYGIGNGNGNGKKEVE